MRVLLDTHILVYWCADPDSLSKAQTHALAQISANNPAVVADITLWEIAMLVQLRRLHLDFPIRDWLNRAVAPPLVRVASITPAIAGQVSSLSNWENQDPADRLIVATAQIYGAHIVTNDQLIISSGLVSTI